jgi:chemotaxis signal transduction protein
VESLPGERKALIFSAGGVRLALRLSHLREIVAVDAAAGEVTSRGEALPTAFVSTVLGLPAGASPFALLIEGTPRLALRVEALHGIVDLAAAEVFQLPARTPLPQPAPFSGAVVTGGEVALELAVATLGFAPLEPAAEGPAPGADGVPADRELRFSRGGRAYAVPLSLLVQVLEEPRLATVPLTPPSHRGLLYHGRALHPVVDLAVVYGGEDAPSVRGQAGRGRPSPLVNAGAEPRREHGVVLLVDAGGAGVGVVADRVLGAGEGGDDVIRPPWDGLFGG